MSEEASGPEEGSELTHDEWKMEMAAHLGFTNITPEALAQLQVWETVQPNWRSEPVRWDH